VSGGRWPRDGGSNRRFLGRCRAQDPCSRAQPAKLDLFGCCGSPPCPSTLSPSSGLGQSTVGYLSNLSLIILPCLRAGTTTLGKARKSSRVSSDGLERKVSASIVAVEQKAAAVAEDSGLKAVGRWTRERKRSWGERGGGGLGGCGREGEANWGGSELSRLAWGLTCLPLASAEVPVGPPSFLPLPPSPSVIWSFSKSSDSWSLLPSCHWVGDKGLVKSRGRSYYSRLGPASSALHKPPDRSKPRNKVYLDTRISVRTARTTTCNSSHFAVHHMQLGGRGAPQAGSASSN
jgi:hypothetical protein